MRILRIALRGLVLAVTTIVAILVGFGVYHLLKPINQVAVQVPVAAMGCIIGFVSWDFFTQRLPFKGFARPTSSGELVWTYLAALGWSPVIFIPFHYVTQGYLTSIGNILGIWLFQVPVNLLAILAAHKLRSIGLIVLLFLAACTVQPQPAPTSLLGMVTVPAGWFLMGQDGGSRSNWPQHSVYLNAFAIDRADRY